MAEHENLSPASQMLVLSFSVAAVQEIRQRLKKAVEDKICSDRVRFLNIRTFDSFASWLMFRLKDRASLAAIHGYDARIIAATQFLRSDNEKVAALLNNQKHILVDEVQDLVGYRADLTLATLEKAGGGFTLFGDSAQAIYNFQLRDQDPDVADLTSAILLDRIRDRFGDLSEEHKLEKNHRVAGSTHLHGIAVEGRSLILSDIEAAKTYLEDQFGGLQDKGKLGSPRLGPRLMSGDSCVLCRTNGQVLRLARVLHEQKEGFRIIRGRSDQLCPAWPGRLLLRYEKQRLQKEDLEKLCETQGVERPDPEDIWTILLRAARGKKDDTGIDCYDVAEAALTGSIVESLEGPIDDNRLQLSTIHRAKGREFKNVVVVTGDGPVGDGNDIEDDVRVLFVGLTRAKSKLHRMAEGGYSWIRPLKSNGQSRWVKAPKRGDNRPKFTGIEVGLPGDCDSASFAADSVHGSLEETLENQDFLWSRVSPGTPARLRLRARRKGAPIYQIECEVEDRWQMVGEMSSEFGWCLYNSIRHVQERKPRRLPTLIEKIWVRSTTTEVGNTADTRVHDSLRRNSAMWVGLRLEGLGCIREWE